MNLSGNELLLSLKDKLSKKATGRVNILPQGFGFVEIEGGSSVFLPPAESAKVRSGDMVKINVIEDKERQSSTGEIIELVEANTSDFLVQVSTVKDGFAFVEPLFYLGEKSHYYVKTRDFKLVVGDVYFAKINRHPFYGKASAFLVDKVSDFNSPSKAWAIEYAKRDLNFEDAVRKVDATIDSPLSGLSSYSSEIKSLCDIPFVSIDGAGTKDIDDAIWAESYADGTSRVLVAIASPSRAVLSAGLLDSVVDHGQTFYTPGFKDSMLPYDIEDHFSLNESEVRLSLICDIRIGKNGEILDFQFKEAKIQSRLALSYDDVSAYLEGSQSIESLTPDVTLSLQAMYNAYKLRKEFRAGKFIDVDYGEDIRFVVKDWKPVGVKTDKRTVSSDMVSEFMICANMCAGDFLREKLGKGIFKVYPGLDEGFIKDAMKFVDDTTWIETDSCKIMTPEGYIALRNEISQRGDKGAEAIIREYSRNSSYSTIAEWHTGIGASAYATFTSPLRRACDLINHNLILSLISSDVEPISITEATLSALESANSVSKSLERGINAYLNKIYLDDNKDIHFTGKVIRVKKQGLLVRLKETGCVVMVTKFDLGTREKQVVFDEDLLIFTNASFSDEALEVGTMLNLQVRKVNSSIDRIDFSVSLADQ